MTTAFTIGMLYFDDMTLLDTYDPAPPFDSGSPATASPALVDQVRSAASGLTAERTRACEAAASRLHALG